LVLCIPRICSSERCSCVSKRKQGRPALGVNEFPDWLIRWDGKESATVYARCH
jgi:hypothetical protein